MFACNCIHVIVVLAYTGVVLHEFIYLDEGELSNTCARSTLPRGKETASYVYEYIALKARRMDYSSVGIDRAINDLREFSGILQKV